MQKAKLLSFINKYSLGGSVEIIELNLNTDSISTRFMSNQQDVIGDISVEVQNANILDATSVGIANTSLLTKMLSVLDDEIEIEVIQNPTTKLPISIKIYDQTSTINYMVADNSILQKVPTPKNLPEFDYEFHFTRENLSDKFVKATTAFSDVNTFTLSPLVDQIAISVGSTENNIEIKIPSSKGNCTKPIAFSSKLLKEIFIANKDMTGGKFSVIESGLGKLEIFTEGYTISYYLVEIIQTT